MLKFNLKGQVIGGEVFNLNFPNNLGIIIGSIKSKETPKIFVGFKTKRFTLKIKKKFYLQKWYLKKVMLCKIKLN